MSDKPLTTIQVSRETADKLRRLSPSSTYDQTITSLLGGRFSMAEQILFFSMDVNPSTQKEMRKMVKFAGFVREVRIKFPAGCANLVSVRLMHEEKNDEDKQIIPTTDETYVALDDDEFKISGLHIPVSKGNSIRVEWWNYDNALTHTVPVTVVIGEE